MPRESKVLCGCCNRYLSRKIERQHRRALDATPYFTPQESYSSRQQRVFGPSSEADMADTGADAEAGSLPGADLNEEMDFELGPEQQMSPGGGDSQLAGAHIDCLMTMKRR